MPAFVTHDCFAQDVMQAHPEVCGDTRDECEAFLLGSQGPDPLYFGFGQPPVGTLQLARLMHREQPSRLLAQLAEAVNSLEGRRQELGRSYAHGFLMHYLLDSTIHPLVFAQVDAICNAGIDGLGKEDDHVVHTYIERDFDEMVLYNKRGITVRDFKPTSTILQASPAVMSAAQQLYAYIGLTVYGIQIAPEAFARALLTYRLQQRLTWTPTGRKSVVAGQIETLFRRHSYVQSFSLRPNPLESTWLANPDNDTWEDPFTGRVQTSSFWDLYNDALARAWDTIQAFDSPRFNEDAARRITDEVNFCGMPTVATLTVVEGA